MDLLDKEKLLRFLEKLGHAAKTHGTCYITGGTSAILVGWRQTTIDIDLKFDPEPEGVFEAIPMLKRELRVNVELAAPDNFIPPLPKWKERSKVIGTFGKLDVRHYDFVAQALAKLARGHDRDLEDVHQMLNHGLLTEDSIRKNFDEIRPLLVRYPSLDEERFALMLESFFKKLK